MTKQEQQELTRKAVENNQLKALFLGAPEYQWNSMKHMPANVPTDISAIIEHGLYPLYQAGYNVIPELLKETVLDLANGSPIEIWTAFSIIWKQRYDEKRNKAIFSICDNDLIQIIRNSIFQNREKLMQYKEGFGANFKEGLYGDIKYANQTFRVKYGETLL